MTTMTTMKQRVGVPISKWGKDHWSTFAYIETRCVDHKGEPDKDHMRTDWDRHPGLVGERKIVLGGTQNKKYPTRLNNGTEISDHDDWDCAEDAEREGLLKDVGTGLYPRYELTKLGQNVAAALREHKAAGKSFGEFRWKK